MTTRLKDALLGALFFTYAGLVRLAAAIGKSTLAVNAASRKPYHV